MAQVPFTENWDIEAARRRVEFLASLASFSGIPLSETPRHAPRLAPLGSESRAHALRLSAELAFAIGDTARGLELILHAAESYIETEAWAYGAFLQAVFGSAERFDRSRFDRFSSPTNPVQRVYGYLALLADPNRARYDEALQVRRIIEQNSFGRIGPQGSLIQSYLNAVLILHTPLSLDILRANAVRNSSSAAITHLVEGYAASLETAAREPITGSACRRAFHLSISISSGSCALYSKLAMCRSRHLAAPCSQRRSLAASVSPTSSRPRSLSAVRRGLRSSPA